VSAVVVLGNLVLNIPHFTAKVKAFIPRLVSTYEEDTDENTDLGAVHSKINRKE